MPNLELGKHAVYVIPSYAVSAAVILGLVVDTLLRAGRWRREADRREAARDKTSRDEGGPR